MTVQDIKPLLRIIDANLNRSKEAFRVAEDLCRFVLDERSLTRSFKKIRHDITAVALNLPIQYKALLESRESARDIGKRSVITDSGRIQMRDLMAANLKRAQESLRVLEECSKAISKKASRGFQRLRFECYELERKSIQKF